MSFRVFRGFVAAALVSGAAALAPAALFEPLFVVERAVGAVTVEKPDGTVVPAEAEHAYPYGSKITVPDVPPPLTPEPTNPALDEAIKKIDKINDFLMQGMYESFSMEDTIKLLKAAVS